MTVNNAERRSVQPEPAAVDRKDVADVDDWDPDSELSPLSKAVIATAVGLGLLIAAFAVIGKLAGWANDYGTILVLPGVLLVDVDLRTVVLVGRRQTHRATPNEEE